MKDKTAKTVYWILNGIFAVLMLFSGITELLPLTPAGLAVFAALGYPLYLNLILGVAKVLGVVAILQTKWYTIKEWAYAGFAIDMIGAAASFGLSGAGTGQVVFMLPIIAFFFVTYAFWKRAYR